MLEFLSNGIVQGVLVAIIIGAFTMIVNRLKFKRDEKKIITFLKKSNQKTSHTFRSTHAIVSDTNLSENRVRKICSLSKQIRRNQKEKESWTLVE
jgi:CRISPR/Cas system CSM-associated protein Csm2 small subunit